MKIKDLKLNRQRYKRSNFAPGEFLTPKFIGNEWMVADDEKGKEVVLVLTGVDDDDWTIYSG